MENIFTENIKSEIETVRSKFQKSEKICNYRITFDFTA